MQRRHLLLTASLAAGLSLLSGCTTNTGASASPEQQKAQINQGVDNTLNTLYGSVAGSRELASKARGILVFPSILAGGIGLGGEYGTGALRVGGKTVDYYRTTSVSFGFQLGAQSKALVLLFMTEDALNKFRRSSGWTAGADASVALIKLGANGTVDTQSVNNAVNAFALTNGGLMYAATIDGSKISKIEF